MFSSRVIQILAFASNQFLFTVKYVQGFLCKHLYAVAKLEPKKPGHIQNFSKEQIVNVGRDSICVYSVFIFLFVLLGVLGGWGP